MNERTYVVPSKKAPYSREITVKTLCQMDYLQHKCWMFPGVERLFGELASYQWNPPSASSTESR